MDQELISYLDEQFREVNRKFERVDARFDRIDGRLEQIDGRLDRGDARFDRIDGRFERLESTTHETRILMEAMRGDIQLIAEGMTGMDEKSGIFRAEISEKVDEMATLIRQSYKSLECRVEALEARRDRQDRDILEVIRERFGPARKDL